MTVTTDIDWNIRDAIRRHADPATDLAETDTVVESLTDYYDESTIRESMDDLYYRNEIVFHGSDQVHLP